MIRLAAGDSWLDYSSKAQSRIKSPLFPRAVAISIAANGISIGILKAILLRYSLRCQQGQGSRTKKQTAKAGFDPGGAAILASIHLEER